ncbi:hypothetical protein B0H63DRAFT_453338 [Podospora didyma]|uniref:Uncharacterized protein n=1 Tax=Podospora didyma TaxID=330526 RepID=A0AAE0N753_9PEZI|nr:hypothetical protein B0H63DRAFT_453338 [Podospora didyma]
MAMHSDIMDVNVHVDVDAGNKGKGTTSLVDLFRCLPRPRTPQTAASQSTGPSPVPVPGKGGIPSSSSSATDLRRKVLTGQYKAAVSKSSGPMEEKKTGKRFSSGAIKRAMAVWDILSKNGALIEFLPPSPTLYGDALRDFIPLFSTSEAQVKALEPALRSLLATLARYGLKTHWEDMPRVIALAPASNPRRLYLRNWRYFKPSESYHVNYGYDEHTDCKLVKSWIIEAELRDAQKRSLDPAPFTVAEQEHFLDMLQRQHGHQLAISFRDRMWDRPPGGQNYTSCADTGRTATIASEGMRITFLDKI